MEQALIDEQLVDHAEAAPDTQHHVRAVQPFLLDDERMMSLKQCNKNLLSIAKSINNHIRNKSSKSDLVVTNLPDVPKDESAFGYMQFVEHLTSGLERVLLVRGYTEDVITAFT